MPHFKYVALDASGAKVTGVLDAGSAARARNELASRALQVREVKEKKGFGGIQITKKKIKRADLMNFSRQLAAFLRAGIPILDSLHDAHRERRKPRPATVLDDIADALRSGMPLSDAMAAALGAVPDLLHRHPALGRADREPRRGARPARRLHRA